MKRFKSWKCELEQCYEGIFRKKVATFYRYLYGHPVKFLLEICSSDILEKYEKIYVQCLVVKI